MVAVSAGLPTPVYVAESATRVIVVAMAYLTETVSVVTQTPAGRMGISALRLGI